MLKTTGILTTLYGGYEYRGIRIYINHLHKQGQYAATLVQSGRSYIERAKTLPGIIDIIDAHLDAN